MELFNKRITSVDEIKGLEQNELESLFSNNALKLFEEKIVTLDKFISLPKGKKKALISDSTLKLLKKQFIKIDEFIDLEEDKMRTITSPLLMKCKAKTLILKGAKKSTCKQIKEYAESFATLGSVQVGVVQSNLNTVKHQKSPNRAI